MKQNWWKYLAVALVLYSVVAGLMRPLNPGILKVNPISIQAGQSYDITIATYNTDFQSGDDIQSYLKINDTFGIQSQRVVVLAPNELKATFDIPQKLPSIVQREVYSIILSTEREGTFIRPRAVSIVQREIDIAGAIAAWPSNSFGDFKKTPKANFPFRAILYESLRNLFYHVPMWFGMTFLLMGSLVSSVLYLVRKNIRMDTIASSMIQIAVLYGILGCATGAIWARGTWGTWWTFEEIKLNVSAATLLLYFAYFLLRAAIDDEVLRAKISSVYSIIGFVAAVFLLFVLPRMVDSSLHPGNGGNPGFGGEDLDDTLRTVFYPAVIGWTLLGFWLAQLTYRSKFLQDYFLEKYD